MKILPPVSIEARRLLPSKWDLLAAILVLGFIVLFADASRALIRPLSSLSTGYLPLDPWRLPEYAMFTALRMLIALGVSLAFTFSYATWAAKSQRAGTLLVPLLDILQSVPILGFISVTVVFFLSLAPGRIFGAELAAVFAVFTSQAWNMAFSFYQSLRMVPADLDEASRGFRSSGWQRFWRLEVPFAVPGLVWNTMMSMSGGWFFVVASEAIAVGNLQICLPGVGSYVAQAIRERDLAAVGYAVIAMTLAILLCDQLLFRPVVAWADRFRVEQTVLPAVPRSWVLDWYRGSRWLSRFGGYCAAGLWGVAGLRLAGPRSSAHPPRGLPRRLGDLLWLMLVAAVVAWAAHALLGFARASLTWADITLAVTDGMWTLLRVAVLIALAAVIWVPIGVAIGLRPRLTAALQPLAQFLAAFPVNLLFPFAVDLIVRFGLPPRIWLSPLMILGTQWYILFNVIAGTTAFPGDLREAAASFRVRTWRWWREVMLPGVFPYFVTGAITASGGAWNASFVAETVTWGSTSLSTPGLGTYITRATAAGDYPRIALGVAVMSAFVIVMNRLLWRPLYALAERRTRLD